MIKTMNSMIIINVIAIPLPIDPTFSDILDGSITSISLSYGIYSFQYPID